jgi:hypothetical protein
MPGAKSARTVMIVVAVIVIAGLIGAMMLGPSAVPTR